MTDIVKKINSKLPPSAIDKFHANHVRRQDLTDKYIQDILQNVFKTIDPSRLGSNQLQHQYATIKNNLCV